MKYDEFKYALMTDKSIWIKVWYNLKYYLLSDVVFYLNKYIPVDVSVLYW